jgi:MoaA/NifB/PqqE/SkfB family radical SAM enzyme
LEKEGVPYEINTVLTDFNREEIPGLLRFCSDHRVSAKFFEHVKALPVVGEIGVIQAEAMPYVKFSDFEQHLRDALPRAVSLPPDVFNGANEIYDCGGFLIRYCRYLCGYGLCYLSGTRVDPRGFVYACLAGNGRYRISPNQALDDSAAVIEAALRWGCSSGLRAAALLSA